VIRSENKYVNCHSSYIRWTPCRLLVGCFEGWDEDQGDREGVAEGIFVNDRLLLGFVEGVLVGFLVGLAAGHCFMVRQ
jgi:hypothetical protein